MSFFTLSTGQQVVTDGNMEMGGGDLPPIPANTNVLAAIDEAKWDTSPAGEQFISLRWNVLQPADYANRKVFQKVWIKNQDSKKRDKAIAMFAAIDANAGGKLVAAGVEPSDQDLLINLANRPQVLNLQVWTIKEDRNTGAPLPESEWMSGNWVSKVSPRSRQQGAQQSIPAPQQPQQQPVAQPQQAAATQQSAADTFMDDVPF